MQIDREQAKRILDIINELDSYVMAEEGDLELRAQILEAFPGLDEDFSDGPPRKSFLAEFPDPS